MTPSPDAAARAAMLAGLFAPSERIGRIRAIAAEHVPQPHRDLLDHHSHMTVAMERFHGESVALRVVATRLPTATDTTYAREILLLNSQGQPVQYGIVRIDLAALEPAVADQIRAARTPLGRVLIEAGVLCDVQHVQLLEVTPGPHLAEFIGPRPTFGRGATIAVAGRAAVELLEIIAGIDAT
jgi:hypothetical protein